MTERVASAIHAIVSTYGAMVSLTMRSTPGGTFFDEVHYYREWYILYSLGFFVFDIIAFHIWPQTMWSVTYIVHHSMAFSSSYLVFVSLTLSSTPSSSPSSSSPLSLFATLRMLTVPSDAIADEGSVRVLL